MNIGPSEVQHQGFRSVQGNAHQEESYGSTPLLINKESINNFHSKTFSSNDLSSLLCNHGSGEHFSLLPISKKHILIA